MRRAVYWVLGLSTVGCGLAAVNLRHDSSAPAIDWQLFRPSPPRVVVAQPTRGPIARTIAAKGVVEPIHQSAVGARVGGRVAEILVAEGTTVDRDQPLIRLDEAPFRKRLDAAQARLDTASKNLGTAQAHLKDIEKEPAAATTPSTSPAPAPAPIAASPPTLASLAALRNAGGGVTPSATSAPTPPALPTKLAAARDSVDGWDRERKAAEAARDAARTDLDRATLRAPIAGVVEDLNVAVGDDVVPRPVVSLPSRADGPGGSAGPMALMGGAVSSDVPPDLGIAPDRPLCVILDPDQLRIRAWVDEADVGLIFAEQRVRVFLPDEPTESVSGRISRVAPRGRPNGEVVAFAAVVAFDDAGHRARVGMRVNIEVEVARRADPLGVPVQAVLHRRRRDLVGSVPVGPTATADRDGYVRAVFVLDGDRARFRPIETGLSDERRVEIVGGLAETDRVIVGPFRSLDALDDGTIVVAEADEAPLSTGSTLPSTVSAPPNGFGPPR